MRQTGDSCWDKPSCSTEKPCNVCSYCEEEPQVELDGEITLYESSLGIDPFKK